MRRALAVAVAFLIGACTSATTPTTDTDTATGGTPVVTTAGTGAAAEPGLTCWEAPASGASGELAFEDITSSHGLLEPLKGMHGHAAIWADTTGDDRPDLFVGTFADRDDERYRHRGADGPSPDRLLIGGPEGFTLDESLEPVFSRTSGGVGADLDLDGDIDLVISRNSRDSIGGAPATQLLRNDGGQLVPVDNSGLPTDIGGRSVAVLDHNHDAWPDLFIAEDRWSGGSSVLMENLGGMEFADVTENAGLPPDIHGLGVAAADLTRDGHADLFVAGSNRLFIANGDGTFHEADGSVFTWETFGDEDDVAGASVADVNRDGWLDLAVGHHYNSTLDFEARVPVRLYLNRGLDDGDPVFEDVTMEAGLPGLPTKAPHVELNDFDNDGWPDLLTSASAAAGAHPAIFRHEGLVDGVPRFSEPEGLGEAQYWVAAPSADVDRDGSLDIFLLEWEPALPSVLLGNRSDSGHWLEVSVGPEHGHGIGWLVEIFEEGALLGSREITVTQGYSAGVSPIAHFGLGDATEITVRLTPPGDSPPIELPGVGPDRHLRYPGGCSG